MDFEWDEAKRQETLAARGVDFSLAAFVFGDADRKTVVDDRRLYGEVRYLTLGRVGTKYYLVAHTQRGSKTRIITAWKVGQDGKTRFEKLFGRRHRQDD